MPYPNVGARVLDIPGVPDFPSLARAVLRRSTSTASAIHGEEHWRAVSWIGLHLARETPEADPVVALLFGLFHDARRENDGTDPEHGLRGAELALSLRADRLRISDRQMALLAAACVLHTEGLVSDEPTVGACWDADRLNLWRLGRQPDPVLLSTIEARSSRRIRWARDVVGRVPSWAEICRTFFPSR